MNQAMCSATTMLLACVQTSAVRLLWMRSAYQMERTRMNVLSVGAQEIQQETMIAIGLMTLLRPMFIIQ